MYYATFKGQSKAGTLTPNHLYPVTPYHEDSEELMVLVNDRGGEIIIRPRGCAHLVGEGCWMLLKVVR